VTAKASAKLKKLETLEAHTREALANKDWMAADSAAFDGVSLAYAMNEYGLMPALLEMLKEARGRRFRQAVEMDTLVVIDDIQTRDEILEIYEEQDLTPGTYLIQPPLVGADGRNMRDHYFALGVPSLFIVREPTTRDGLWPIVMIGPITVRTRVEPPENEQVTIEWIENAAYELGDAAIETVDPGALATVRVDQLLDRLGTVVLHDRLIDLLAETCVEAQAQVDAARAEKERKKKAAEAS